MREMGQSWTRLKQLSTISWTRSLSIQQQTTPHSCSIRLRSSFNQLLWTTYVEDGPYLWFVQLITQAQMETPHHRHHSIIWVLRINMRWHSTWSEVSLSHTIRIEASQSTVSAAFQDTWAKVQLITVSRWMVIPPSLIFAVSKTLLQLIVRHCQA